MVSRFDSEESGFDEEEEVRIYVRFSRFSVFCCGGFFLCLLFVCVL